MPEPGQHERWWGQPSLPVVALLSECVYNRALLGFVPCCIAWCKMISLLVVTYLSTTYTTLMSHHGEVVSNITHTVWLPTLPRAIDSRHRTHFGHCSVIRSCSTFHSTVIPHNTCTFSNTFSSTLGCIITASIQTDKLTGKTVKDPPKGPEHQQNKTPRVMGVEIKTISKLIVLRGIISTSTVN